MTRECNGAVILHEGSVKMIVTEEEDFKRRVMVDKVVLEGCGCYTAHTRRKGRGRLFYFAGAGEWKIKMTVRSVRKVQCYLFL